MNILVITPLYYIEGRPNIFHDTECIHYLIKPWAKDHNVIVIDVYFESLRNVKRYISSAEREYRKGYSFTIDDVKVGFIEVFKPYKQGSRLTYYEKKRVSNFIMRFTNDNDFIPDLIITHIPISVINVVKEIFPGIPKYAVLHSTDKQYWYRRKKETDAVRRTFDGFYARSKTLFDFFEKQGLRNLSKESLYSGGKKADVKENKKEGCIGLVYAGKFIPRKHVEIIIEALSELKDEKYMFEIYGDGPEREKLVRLANEKLKPGTYSFKGSVDREQVLTAMSRNDFFVMVSENECFGLTYVEAMINGCIPIGSKGEGIDGIIIDGETGFLVDVNSVESLRQVFMKCFHLSDTEKKEMLRRMEEASEKYSEKQAGIHYLDTIMGDHMRNIGNSVRSI
jgi:glycosyltransferase involved in cell wall biosynthesis